MIKNSKYNFFLYYNNKKDLCIKNINMKKLKLSSLICSSLFVLASCQNFTPNENNNETENSKINSVISSIEVKEINSSNVSLSNIDSAIIVSALTGGDIEKPNKQKLYFSFDEKENNLLGNELSFGESNLTKSIDKRHHKTLKEFLKEKEMVKKAYLSGKKVYSSLKTSESILKEGKEIIFNVLKDDEHYDKKPSILYKISKKANFWIDKEVVGTLDEKAINKSIKYWDEKAYPIVTSKFGVAPLPPNDVDGDEKINLFITPLKEQGLFGYFDSTDVINEDNSPYSNKTDMLYINSNVFKKGEVNEDAANGTLIHEFQHMVNFNNKVTLRLNNKKEPIYEDRWLDEGMSTYAEQLGGFGLPKNDLFSASYLSDFFDNPSKVQVITNDSGLNYGASLLFVLYLVEQYGEGVLNKLTISDKGGIANVEAVTGKEFNKLFRDWGTALLLSGSGKNKKFDFKSVNLHKSYGQYNLDGINLSNIVENPNKKIGYNMFNWSINYLKINNLKKANLNMNIKHNNTGVLSNNLVKLK